MAVDTTEYHSIHRTGERVDLWIQRTHAEQGRTGSDGGLRLVMEERCSVKMKRENVRSFEEHERTLIGRWLVPFDLATDQEDEGKRGNDGGYCMIYEAHAVSLFGHWAWYGSFGFLFWAKRIYPHTPFNFALFTLTVLISCHFFVQTLFATLLFLFNILLLSELPCICKFLLFPDLFFFFFLATHTWNGRYKHETHEPSSPLCLQSSLAHTFAVEIFFTSQSL